MKAKTTKYLKYDKALKTTLRTVDQHFKKDGWDLNFCSLVEEFGYNVHGVHLSNLLLEKLMKKRKVWMKNGELVVSKIKEKK